MSGNQTYDGSSNCTPEKTTLSANSLGKVLQSDMRADSIALVDGSMNKTAVLLNDSPDQTVVLDLSPNKTVASDVSLNKTVIISDSSTNKTVSLSGSSNISVASESLMTDKMITAENDEFSSQELWEIAAKTATLSPKSTGSPVIQCLPREEIDAVPETPPDLESEGSMFESGSPKSLPIGNILPKIGHLSYVEKTGLTIQRVLAEQFTENESCASCSSLFDPSDTPMDVEYIPPIVSNPGREQFDFSTVDNIACLTGAWTDFGRYPDNFLRGCKWAPDGSCILTNSSDGYLRLFNLPDIFYPKANQGVHLGAIPEMRSVLKMYDGDLVYDYCWYPRMTSLDAVTSCFVSTSRYSPIHMFDAYTGELRCSYRAFNQMDELESAYCITFSCDGQKLYSGFDKTIRVFDVSVPGRECDTRKTKANQTGIISCIAVNPDRSGIYAAGSYLKTIGLYSEKDACDVDILTGQQGGVTHLMFSLDGTKLFTGGRKDPEILCWDLRNRGKYLHVMQREVTTNQRIYFDIDSTGQYLTSGSVTGHVYIWDTWSEMHDAENEELILKPKLSFSAQDDCTNGVSFHPTLPVIATASGQRKFAEPIHSEDSESDDDSSIFTDRYIVRDNSLKLWGCSLRYK